MTPRPVSSSFVGRAADLEAVGRALDSGERLVTLTGPGGIGKTRLATEIALRRLADVTMDGEGGVFFCDLAEARDLDGILAAVSRALDVPLATARSSEEATAQLGRAIAARGPALVVLDNFEQLVAHAPRTVADWRAAAPEASFLVTSRERLHLSGEVAIELGPLSVESEAVALLVDRVRRVRRDYAPTDAERPILEKIARALDGIPLAIELAAARLSVLGPAALLERLGARFQLLRHGTGDAAARQRTLEETIDWSWKILEPHERTALAQCAVFRGGFSVDAAEGVLDLPDRATAPPVLDVVQALRDKSLLRAYEPPGFPGEVRLGLYRVVQDYAAARLAEIGAGSARARHAAYYAREGDRLAQGVDGREGSARLGRLSLERENLEAAFEYAAEAEPTAAIRALLAIDRLFWIRGPLGAHLAALDTALQDPKNVSARLRAAVHRARGNTRRRLGPAEQGRADLEAALALAFEGNDESLAGEILCDLAALGVQKGAWAEAREAAVRAIDILLRAGDRHGLALARGVEGAINHQEGRLDDARASYEVAIALHRESGNVRGEGMCWTALAAVHVDRGTLADARACQEKGMAIQREIADRFQGYSLYTLGVLSQDAGDLAAARTSYDEARAVAETVGDRRLDALCQGYVALIEMEEGKLEEAEALVSRATAVLAEGWDRRYGALLEGLHGGVQAMLDRVDGARTSFEKAEKALSAPGDVLLFEAVQLLRGLLDLAHARHATVDGDAAKASALREAARARRSAAVAGDDGGRRSLAARSAEARILLRVLDRALAAKDEKAPARRVVEDPTVRALVLHPDGRWFRAPAGERVECHRRASMRRMLLALAKKRLDAPGEPIGPESLLAIGWPGERILPDAARNRLHVTLTRLRQLGLGDVLLSREGGYLIDPATPVRFVEG